MFPSGTLHLTLAILLTFGAGNSHTPGASRFMVGKLRGVGGRKNWDNNGIRKSVGRLTFQSKVNEMLDVIMKWVFKFQNPLHCTTYCMSFRSYSSTVTSIIYSSKFKSPVFIEICDARIIAIQYYYNHYLIKKHLQLSEDQIYALAPDETSKKSGKELANPSKWVSKGVNAEALWGECQGSGSKPYQTQIDVANLAFKCSCPSRKFPCKHGLGLLLLYTRQGSSFTINEAPAWVTDWISRRAEKEEKKTEKKEKLVDESAQAKRQQAREQKVANGIAELLLWMKDMIRNGIIDIPEKKAVFWDTMAKRMVDAQATGLAGMVRELSTINFYKEGWQNKFTDQLAKLYLLTQAYKNIGSLPEEWQADIRSLIGFTQNQEELKMNTGIKDDWFVLGKQVTQEDQLTVERNCLYGTHTKRMALVLQFFVRNQLPGVTLTPGMSVQAELVFFPSALPLRALLKQQFGTVSAKKIAGFKNWEQVAMEEANYNQLQPFVSSYPFIVEEVTPVHFNNSWWLQDVEKRMMKIEEGFINTWKLLAISGGSSLSLAVVGKENNYTPLGAWQNGSYKILS